jgi:hypothetical protein
LADLSRDAVGDAVDPVEGARQISCIWRETEEADDPIDVHEEDGFARAFRHRGI